MKPILATNNGKVIQMSKLQLSTQILELQNEIHKHIADIKEKDEKIAKLEKTVEDNKSTIKYHQDKQKEAQEELNQVHSMLDAFSNPVARKGDGENSWYTVDRTASTRLAAWFASK